MKKIVLTGGPNVGKTALVEVLAKRFYIVSPEAARLIIDEERPKKSDVLPWKDVAKFQEVVAKRQLELEAKAKGDLMFFDRGVVDGAAYCKVSNIPVPQIILDNARGRYDKVFFLEPFPIQAEEKTRSRIPDETAKIHQAVREIYIEFGYEPIVVPALPPEKRVDYILNLLK